MQHHPVTMLNHLRLRDLHLWPLLVFAANYMYIYHEQVVFEGLGVLVPLMSGELLLFPKLCHSYFALLSHMVEVYPEQLASLPGKRLSSWHLLCAMSALHSSLSMTAHMQSHSILLSTTSSADAH